MEYIRTKDKIYGFVPNIVSSIEYDEEMGVYNIYYFNEDKGEHLEQDGKGGHSMDSIWNKDIVAKADTIVKLCDAFVYRERVMSDLKELLLYKKFIGGNKGTIYGAIWTDKGLIYVAKMNDEGILKLL